MRDREKLSIEAIALSAKVDIPALLGEILLAMREQSVNTVKFIAVASHPDVMKARVAYAQTPGGYRDRDRVDEILGAIKPSGGNTFINRFFASGSPEEPESEPVETSVDDVDFVFPDVSVMQEKVQPMRQKMLKAGE